MNLSIIILCHKRTSHLKRVLESLRLCEGIEEANIIFVAHDSPKVVLDLISRFPSNKKTILKVNQLDFVSQAQAINSNLFSGLRHGFQVNKSDVCCVIEDDILLSPDALTFMTSSVSKFNNDPHFRGVIAYSMTSRAGYSSGDVVKINFGIGWGWCINQRNFHKLLEFWTGSEATHWDYFVEPYFRTGYLIAPVYSKVMNIGFDDSGTHTHSQAEIGDVIANSFFASLASVQTQIKEVAADYAHSRADLIVITRLSYFQRQTLYFLRVLSYKIYLLGINNRPKFHFSWRVLRNLIDQKFANVSTLE
jgi:hypothetical protein